MVLSSPQVCVQALFYAVVLRPVDPEVNDRLGQETVIKREGAKQGGKVHPPCGFGLLQAKEEARKVRALRSLMKVKQETKKTAPIHPYGNLWNEHMWCTVYVPNNLVPFGIVLKLK